MCHFKDKLFWEITNVQRISKIYPNTVGLDIKQNSLKIFSMKFYNPKSQTNIKTMRISERWISLHACHTSSRGRHTTMVILEAKARRRFSQWPCLFLGSLHSNDSLLVSTLKAGRK